MKQKLRILAILLAMLLVQASCGKQVTENPSKTEVISVNSESSSSISNADASSGISQSGSSIGTVVIQKGEIPEGYSYPENGDFTPWVYENDDKPYFTDKEKKSTEAFELYSELDDLGRCGVAYANICKELMPTESRGEIGSVKPAGWHTVKYDVVNGKYLYNRCHLIGFQLAGENANEKNLITGTRYLNIDGMLDHENEIADYVRDTGNHVLYRVTPRYTGDNLLCDGLLMEAWSVEDKGKGVCFCIFARNIQPGIAINYANGDSFLVGSDSNEKQDEAFYAKGDRVYVVNRSTHKFHVETCQYAINMDMKNREEFEGEIDWLLDNGFEPCKVCKPDQE